MPIQPRKIYLIVGGDGMIGRHLYQRLEGMGKQVLHTTYRKRPQRDDSVYLDLEKNTENWVVPQGIKTAFFCAAKTSTLFCENNIDASRKINVVNTIKIIEKLSQKKIPIIFLSSSQVFDGSSPYPDETSLATPKTEYGRQKVAVEEALKHIAPNHSVVRTTKIIHPAYPLFNDWISSLSRGVSIYPFNDFYFSPVSIAFFVAILIKISANKTGGVWHVSGDKDLSYYDAASLIAKKMGADPGLVCHSKAKDKLKQIHSIQSTVLKCSRMESLGINPPEVGETIINAMPHL